MPCMNNGVCMPLFNTCSFTCKCDSSTSYGDFCQYTLAPVVFTAQSTVSLLSNIADFSVQLRPCLVKSWQTANPQFACPPGYQIIPGIDGCFAASKIPATNNAKFTKANAEYQCSLTGGSLVSLETPTKLAAIRAWLTLTKNR